MIERRKTRQLHVGSVAVGGDAPIAVQSMTNTHTDDAAATLEQIQRLADAGCDIIRCAVPDMAAAEGLKTICKESPIPVIADIHFDYRLAVEAVAAGVDKVRINPGNIGADDRVKKVVEACRSRNIPIRIGVNSGSVEKDILAKYGAPTPEAMAESAMYHASLLEKFDFDDIVISIKSSNVGNMIKAYETVAERCDYPLHLGVTEAGTERMGLIKSSAGIGSLLMHGIGDTVRVSLTADPVKEVYAGLDILKALDLRSNCVQIVSCPTCGRTKIDLIKVAGEVENALRDCRKPLKVAVMGCVVNGPGEAKEADIGIAGGDGCAVLIKKGEIIRKIKEEDIVSELLAEIEKI